MLDAVTVNKPLGILFLSGVGSRMSFLVKATKSCCLENPAEARNLVKVGDFSNVSVIDFGSGVNKNEVSLEENENPAFPESDPKAGSEPNFKIFG